MPGLVGWLPLGLLVFALQALTPTPSPPTGLQPIALLWPQENTVLTESPVRIQGRTAVPLFLRADLAFQPLPWNQPKATPHPQGWFLLAVMEEPVVEGVLAEWDISFLASGPYLLRLRVERRSGVPLEHKVLVWIGSRPGPVGPPPSPTPTPMPSRTVSPSPTPSPVPDFWWIPTPMVAEHPFPQRWRQGLGIGLLVGFLGVMTLWVLNQTRRV